MKKLLLTLSFCFLSFSTNASTLLNLICDQQSFESKQGYYSKDLGHSFPDGERFFQLEFDKKSQRLETDMVMVIDSTIVVFENKNNLIEIITERDNLNFIHVFEVNRFTGEIKQIRYHWEDDTRIEIYLYKCKSAKIQF